MAKNSWDVSHLCRVLYNIIRSLSLVAESSCDAILLAAVASAADSAETFEGRPAVHTYRMFCQQLLSSTLSTFYSGHNEPHARAAAIYNWMSL